MAGRLTAIPLTPRVGSEIRIDVETLLSGAAAREIRGLLEARGAICFRDIHLSDDQQVRFARTLGTISDESPHGIVHVSANAKLNPNPRTANYQRSSFFWHLDGFGRDTPFLATMLNAKGLAESGGETEIANLYAAYDDLPADEKRRLAPLRVVHGLEPMMRCATPWPSFAELSEWQRAPNRVHPLVWTHRSGRKTLMIGASASHIDGMDLDEGRALICRLNEWATQPDYVYRHEWRLGDLLVWDNTGVLHRAVPYSLDSVRMMHRTTLFGEEPVA